MATPAPLQPLTGRELQHAVERAVDDDAVLRSLPARARAELTQRLTRHLTDSLDNDELLARYLQTEWPCSIYHPCCLCGYEDD